MTNRYTQNRTKLRKGEYVRANNTFEYKWFDSSGKRHSTYAQTLSELRKKEEKILRDSYEGVDYSKLNLSINQYYEKWKSVKTGIRETTLASYVRVYERYIESDIGKMKLKNISYSTVVLFFKKLAVEKGLSYNTISKVEVCLSMVLDLAVKDEVLRKNPCQGALKELHREYGKNVKTVHALTLKQQKQFEDFLSRPGHYHQYYPIFSVMLWSGARVGEILGLRWEDIDFENDEISINHILIYYDKGKERGSSYKINPPKTKSSYRTIPMLPKVKEALLEEKARQELLGIKCVSVIDGYTNFVFVNSKGNVLSHKKLNHRLSKISEAINKEIKSKNDSTDECFPHVHNHMLRHTFATRMREAGADMKATSEMMGHEGLLLTLTTYTDASSEFKKREIATLMDYYENAI